MDHKIVSREEWLGLRKELLEKEKEFTQARENMSALRRALPWVRIDKEYRFQSVEGPLPFAEIFDGSSQLIVYHFMFGPDWEEGCKSCSFWADSFNNAVVHLKQRDTQLAAISRAPIEKLQKFKNRMNWTFPWYSSFSNDFNEDFQVSFPGKKQGVYNYGPSDVGEEMPGMSVFYKDENDTIYHTYSRYARGLDLINGIYHLLDMTPKGRNEAKLSYTQAWIKLKDRYAANS